MLASLSNPERVVAAPLPFGGALGLALVYSSCSFKLWVFSVPQGVWGWYVLETWCSLRQQPACDAQTLLLFWAINVEDECK